MIVCPLCQNSQAQGVECDVCGRPFPESLVSGSGHAPPPVEPVPGLDTTQVAEPPASEAPPVDAPCNWCGHVQAAGRVCDACGRQRRRGPAVEADSAAPGAEEEPMGYCRECGFASPPPTCRNCGTRVQLPEEG